MGRYLGTPKVVVSSLRSLTSVLVLWRRQGEFCRMGLGGIYELYISDEDVYIQPHRMFSHITKPGKTTVDGRAHLTTRQTYHLAFQCALLSSNCSSLLFQSFQKSFQSIINGPQAAWRDSYTYFSRLIFRFVVVVWFGMVGSDVVLNLLSPRSPPSLLPRPPPVPLLGAKSYNALRGRTRGGSMRGISSLAA